jgi:hypothetical protein
MDNRSGTWVALLCTISGACVSAQQNRGFTFAGTSAYSSISYPGPDLAASGGITAGAGGSATFGWFGGTSVRGLSITYTPSYFYSREGSYSVGTTLSHSVILTSTAKIRPKLFLEFSLNGQILRANENLFSTSLEGQTAVSSTSIDQLAAKPSDAQTMQASASPLAVGTRYLNSAAALGLSYKATPRFSLNFRVGGARVQTLEGDATDLQFASSTAVASAGFSYSISPRTQIGGEVNSRQIWSTSERARVTNMLGSVTRNMGRQWFAQAQAGTGLINSTNRVYYQAGGPQFVGGGSIGFKTNTHTLTATVMKSLADPYGLQGASTLNIGGGWNWQRPGRRWSLFASGGNQIVSVVNADSMNIWHANAGWNRSIKQETDLSIAYAYGTMLSGVLQTPYAAQYAFIARHGVQLTVHWHPPRVFR